MSSPPGSSPPAEQTPRPAFRAAGAASRIASSPLFYSSSPVRPSPSSRPRALSFMNAMDVDNDDGDDADDSDAVTPRASRNTARRSRLDEVSSPLRYSSSSPAPRTRRSSSLGKSNTTRSGNLRSELYVKQMK